MKLSRAKLEQLVGDLVERVDGAVPASAWPTPSCRPSQIDEVVLVGGSDPHAAIVSRR